MAVIRFFHLALLIGAMFGFVGQGFAMAMTPNCCAAIAHRTIVHRTIVHQTTAHHGKVIAMVSKMDCCPKAPAGKTGSRPAKDAMPNCPMLAGSFVSLPMGNGSPLLSLVPIKAAIADWPLTAPLAGRATAPESPPPTI